MKAFQKDKRHPATVCASLWVTPSSLSHSPLMWFGSSSDPISSVVEKKKKERNGSLHYDKRTVIGHTAVKKSLSPSGLKCPKEACPCSVWVPEADRQTDRQSSTDSTSRPPGTCLTIQPDKRKWLKATDGEDVRAGGGVVYCITSI